jgi:hypothetical protein
MTNLTYRGIVYQKSLSAPKREAVSDVPHTYRGTKYHYEPSYLDKKISTEEVSS